MGTKRQSHTEYREKTDNPFFPADEVGLRRPRRGAGYYWARYGTRAVQAAATGQTFRTAYEAYIAGKGTRQNMSREQDMVGKRQRTQLATRKYVQRCMRNMLEKKEIDIVNIVGNSGVPTSSGRVDPYRTYSIIQGTTDDTRTGNFIKRLRVTMRWYCTIGTSSFTDSFRAILVHDKQTNGATPAITDILSTANTLSGFNGDNVIGYGGTRFRILRDSGPFNINGMPYGVVGTFAGVSQGRCFTWHITKGLGVCQFDASAGAITDIVSGELFVVTICTGATGSMQCNSQLIYHDG